MAMIDIEVGHTFDRRSALFLTTGAVLTSVLVLRMLQMQVFNYRDYKKKSENNSFRIQINMPERGKILSREGIPISHDAPIYRIYVVPEETDNLDELLNTLTIDLKLREKTLKRIWAQIRKQQKFQPVLISEHTDWKNLARVSAKNLPGVHISSGFSRVYEMGESGAHIFGYVGAPKNPVANAPFFTTGITGLEKRFNDDMAGTPGQTVMLSNAVGRITGEDEEQFIQPTPGVDIKTTVRWDAQRVLYDTLIQHNAGCGVALDIETGDILAMTSAPGFDAGKFTSDDADEYVEKLMSDYTKPFVNKTVEGLFPPGSTFKIVVALAALESGAVTPDETVYCPGYWDYGDRRYHCWEHKGHGTVNLAGALAHSCDIYFYRLALKIGIDVIRKMALRLGLGEKYMTDIFPKEMAGNIPDKYWKEKHVGAQWVHGDTVISGIGQGFILTNCLQLAIMIARAMSNKIVVPRLIYSDEKPKFKSLGLSEKNIKFVQHGLEQVTQPGGTASGSAINIDGAKMAGKTGTSQVRNISKAERATGVLSASQLEWNKRNHGLFVGYAPLDAPKYAVCVITEHSGGSGPAARTCAAVMKTLLQGDK
ncbi:MAG: penicillin-binding protein 2 [Alphaproteobacteria bacterium]|nr:penicillin-binding protein 2 [Alphaproteobacteria bacterium]